jgi:hypothetical protein
VVFVLSAVLYSTDFIPIIKILKKPAEIKLLIIRVRQALIHCPGWISPSLKRDKLFKIDFSTQDFLGVDLGVYAFITILFIFRFQIVIA